MKSESVAWPVLCSQMMQNQFRATVHSIYQTSSNLRCHQLLGACWAGRLSHMTSLLLCEAQAELGAEGMRTTSAAHFMNHCGLEFAVFVKQVSFHGTKCSMEIANIPSQTNEFVFWLGAHCTHPTYPQITTTSQKAHLSL